MTQTMPPPSGWPPAEPVFDRDVLIDEGMFVSQRTLYSIKVRHVSPPRDLNGWLVQIDVVGNTTSHLTLLIDTSLLPLFDGPQLLAQHILGVLRDWIDLPEVERPHFLDLK